MLTGRDIIYFANDWAGPHRTSSHHIARELEKTNRIIYVETGGMRGPKRTKKDLKRILSRFFSWLKMVRRVNGNFYIYSMLIVPFYKQWAYKLNACLNIFILKRTMKRLKFKEPILWFFAPHVSYLMDYLPHKAVIYYATDNMAESTGADRDAVERIMAGLLKKSNVVFATAESLYNLLRQKNIKSNIHYSPHAVDFQHFAKAQDKDLPIARELKDLKKPVIGFVGFIEDKWVDLDLVAHVAKARPDWSVVLTGEAKIPLDAIKGCGNVIITGYKRYEDLPSYLKAFDVCVIPFHMNELTRNANPIKLKEYLAAGKPVVTVRLPESEKFKALVGIADSYEDFVNKIEEAYKTDSADLTRMRMESVKSDTWPARAEKISDIIERALKTSESDKLKEGP